MGGIGGFCISGPCEEGALDVNTGVVNGALVAVWLTGAGTIFGDGACVVTV